MSVVVRECPITRALIEDGFTVYGIDASPSLVAAFRHWFPDVQCACEAAQESVFFHRTFDAVVSIGVLFLLSADDQREVLHHVASALRLSGRFLFTAPWQTGEWQDVLTGRQSKSLGKKAYERLLEASGLRLVGCHQE